MNYLSSQKRSEKVKARAHDKLDIDEVEQNFARQLKYSLAKDSYTATDWDRFVALSLTIRDFLIERWMETQQNYHRHNLKRVYYISLEYLIGRALANNIINLDMDKTCEMALKKFGIDWTHLCSMGVDAGLGNGGLGRLAACFLDSMATLSLPATGYGLHYDFGIFRQTIKDGYQIEEPDEWLRSGNPWEIERPEYTFQVDFGGSVNEHQENGRQVFTWHPAHHVLGVPYDTPIIGFGSENVNTLRLWSAKASAEFDFEDFNQGDYIQAVQHKIKAETLTKVLYPNDTNYSGKSLRFEQQYFFVSCSLQDIVRRFKVHNKNFEFFPQKVAIQLNDTHPTMGIAELMHILMDKEELPWDTAWKITVDTFGYTNHTLLPEALEKWPVDFFAQKLPRHLQIIYEINRRFLEKISMHYPGDNDRLCRMSIIEESHPKQVRMAHLATVGSHSINGVAALHTHLLKQHLFRDFYDLYPERFNNKTNGVTPRRWLLSANPALAKWISDIIGREWICDLDQLRRLEKFAMIADQRDAFGAIKDANKLVLSRTIVNELGIEVDPKAIFDVHIKRFHEYKRQLLNALHIVMLYNRLKQNPQLDIMPRVFIFSGKAAPGYYMAKMIIKFIHSLAYVINQDEDINGRIKIVFFPNYSVSLAEKIIPAADISEQISTAGMEASGTGNMKMTLNGALTVGTLDGANIEIKDEVGDENIFIFGLKADEIETMRRNNSYNPYDYYHQYPEIKSTIDMAFSNYFCLHNPGLFEPIRRTLFDYGDRYFVLADLLAYAQAQSQADRLYRDRDEWNCKSLLNVARSGKFSSDRVIREYAQEIWRVEPFSIDLNRKGCDTIVEARISVANRRVTGLDE